jgi:uncharacterized protein (DUF1778 family)
MKKAEMDTKDRKSTILTLGNKSRAVFIKALRNPPAPNKKALDAAKRFKKEVR